MKGLMSIFNNVPFQTTLKGGVIHENFIISFSFLGMEFITFKSIAGILQISLSHTQTCACAFEPIPHKHTRTQFPDSSETLIKYQGIGYFVIQSQASKMSIAG